MLDKLHNEGKDKRKEHEYESRTKSNKCKGKTLKFLDNESNSSSGINVRWHKEKHKYSNESSDSDNSPKKRKYKPYEEIPGEFKKIKPPMFNGEVENCEEVEAWLSDMKKYFQIYNYSDRLKVRMVIYNLTGKADIWWKDIKRVKNIK